MQKKGVVGSTSERILDAKVLFYPEILVGYILFHFWHLLLVLSEHSDSDTEKISTESRGSKEEQTQKKGIADI